MNKLWAESPHKSGAECVFGGFTPEVTPEVTPQVAHMLQVLIGEQSRLQKYRLSQTGKAWLEAVGGGDV